ncbi:unnamed protein product [Sphagnum compactum]
MQSGTGEFSYTLNSRVQALALQRLHPMLQDVINHFKLPQDGIIRVADLGCSIGANTLNVANVISSGLSTNGALEIQYFFNDLPTNDFNTLFQQLPSLDQVLGGNQNNDAGFFDPLKLNQSNTYESNFQLQQPNLDFGKNTKEMEGETSTRLYYAAAVPGSFWERLFPSSSLHLIFSSNALHWMTNFPKVIQDKTSSAYNKGQTYINDNNPKAFEACGGTFQKNLQKFFIHRATELVSGGILILIFGGRWTNLPTAKINDGPPHPSEDNFIDVAEASWEDLISKGLITTELRDSINVPIYLPSMEEVRMALDETNVFLIQKFEVRKQIASEVQGSLSEKSKLFDDIISNSWNAIYGEVLKVDIGEELANTYFQHLNQNLAKSDSKDWLNFMCEFLVVLVRK